MSLSTGAEIAERRERARHRLRIMSASIRQIGKYVISSEIPIQLTFIGLLLDYVHNYNGRNLGGLPEQMESVLCGRLDTFSQ
jgi:hypothetical protein